MAQHPALQVTQVIGNVAVGGAERHLLDLVHGLGGRGVGVEVICPRPGPLSARLEQRGVPVRYVELATPRPGDEYALDWAAVQSLVALFRERRPDLVHSHLYPAHLHASLAAAELGVRAVVQTAHTLVVRPGDVLLGRLGPALTIASAGAVAERLGSAGVPPERIRVIYNGVGPEQFEVDPRAVAERRAQLRLGDGPVVGTAARLAPEKGVDLLLRAARSLLDAVPSATLLITGDGPRRAELLRLAEELRLGEQVRFLGARGDVAVLNRLLDVFVLPSRAEACPMALLEAMAAGRAVVATCVGGSAELVRSGVDGCLVPPEDPAALAAAVRGLLDAPGQRAALGAAAREKVALHFTRDQMVSRTLDLYHELLASSAGSAPSSPRARGDAG